MKKTVSILLFVFGMLLPTISFGATVEYTYDNNGRLTKTDYGGIVFDHTYDHIGNVLTDTITINSNYNGDLDNDGNIDLVDSILALQIIVGLEPSVMIHQNSDVNNDQQLGMSEAIFILQHVANQ
jgi:hypothetical protein